MHGTPLFLFPPYRPLHKKRHRDSDAPTARCEKTAEERFNMLARGWLAYPVTSMHAHLPPKSGCRSHIPRLANNLYNRSSAVDSLIHNQPQVGKPTWGYNYTTARRRLPHPSSTTSKNAIRPSATTSKNAIRPSATIPIKKTPPIINGLRQRRDAEKTAEERFNMLARGWLAYPVTSMHAHLPPKSGCRNPISRLAILVLFDYFRNKMFYELHRCIIPHRFFDKRPRSHSRQRASR